MAAPSRAVVVIGLDALPVAALSRVLDALTWRDLCAVAQTCRTLRALADEDARWAALAAAAWRHTFWHPTPAAASGAWKAACRARAALDSRRVDRIMVTCARRGVRLVAPTHAPAALAADEAAGLPLDAGIVDSSVGASAWCPFARHVALVSGGAVRVHAVEAADGTLSATPLVSWPLSGARLLYVFWARCGRRLLLLGVEGAGLVLRCCSLDELGAAPYRSPPLAAGTPLFCDTSPDAPLLCAHAGPASLTLQRLDGAQRGATALPLAADADAAARLADHGTQQLPWFQAPCFSADGRHLYHGELVRLTHAAASPLKAALAVCCRAVDAPPDAPPLARWLLSDQPLGQASRLGFAFAPSPDGRCLALLEHASALLRVESLDGAFSSEAPREFPAAPEERAAPPLLTWRRVVGPGGTPEAVRLAAWAPGRPAGASRLLLLLAPHAIGMGFSHWAVWQRNDTSADDDDAAAAAAAPALVRFPSPPGTAEALDAVQCSAFTDGAVCVSAAFAQRFVPFSDQMSRGESLWAPDGRAFCYAAHDPRADAQVDDEPRVWVQRVAEDARGRLAAQQPPPVPLCRGQHAHWSPR